jgi:hypothetical protein
MRTKANEKAGIKMPETSKEVDDSLEKQLFVRRENHLPNSIEHMNL